MAVFTRQRIEANIAAGGAIRLMGEDLSELNLSGLKLGGASLEGANLWKADLHEANLERADLRKADLHEANLCEANLSHACLDGANLREANLRGAKLSGAKLRGASWPEANLEGAKLRRARLGKVDLRERTLHRVDLRQVNLNGANLYKINLQEVNLNGAKLREVNLNAAQLSGVDLRGADLTAAALEHAQLHKVDLTAAVLDRVRLLFANYDKQTQWPTDFEPSSRGASILTDNRDLMPSFSQSSLTPTRSSGAAHDGRDLTLLFRVIVTFGIFVLCFVLPFNLPAHISLLVRLVTRFLEILYVGGGLLGIFFVLDTIFGEKDERGFSAVRATVFLTLATVCFLLQIFRFPLTFTLLGQVILIPLISIFTWAFVLILLDKEKDIAAATLQNPDSSLEGTRQEPMSVHSHSLQTEKRGHFQHALPDSDVVIQGTTAVASSAEKIQITDSNRVTTKPWNIPFSRNSFFTGREDILAALSSALYTDRPVVISQPQAMSGFGGTGKTQLAIEYAYQHVHDYKAFLWVPATNAEVLFLGLAALANLLELPERREADQNKSVSAVERWLRSHHRWLLILDNVDDLNLLPSSLLQTSQGHLIITTQSRDRQQDLQCIEVGALSAKHGALLLLRRAGLLAPDAPLEQASSEEKALAFQLVQRMEGQPLALDQAGAYLAATGMSLQEYRRMYQKRRQVLHRQRGAGVPHHPEPVITTWSLSFQQVEQHDRAAADLLRLCAVLAPEAIPEELLLQGAAHLGPELELLADSYRLAQAIDTLHAYALLERDSNTRLLFVHRQVQATVLDAMAEQESRLWVQRLILALDAVFPPIEQETWQASDRLMPHIIKCATHVQSWGHSPQELALLLSKAAKYLSNRKRDREAEPLYLQALHIWEQTQSLDHPAQASSMCELADLFYQQRKYTEAELLYRRVLRIREQAYGSDHLEVAHPLQKLARLCFWQGKDEEAEPLYQRALQILEQAYGPDHPDVLSLLLSLRDLYHRNGNEEQSLILTLQIQERDHNWGPQLMVYPLTNLAGFYHKQKRYTETEPLYQRALQILEQVHGPDDYSLVSPLYKLANLFYDQNKYLQAEPLYQRALHIREQGQRRSGYEDPDVVSLLNTLASLYMEQGKYASAEPLYQRALRMQKRKSDPDYPEVTISLRGLAMTYRRQGRYTEAEPLYQRALHILEEAYGPDSPGIADQLNGLALISVEMGNYAQAEPLYQRALQILEKAYGPDSPRVGMLLNNLANLYSEQGQYAQAEPLYQRALHIQEEAYGSDSPDVADPLHGLAELYHKQGNYAQAELLYQRALHILEEAYGPEHPDVADPLHGLANLYRDQGRYEQAKPLYQRALSIREQRQGKSHLETAEVIHDLAIFQEAQGNKHEALSLYKRALAVREQVLGPHHPKTKKTQERAISVLRDLGWHDEVISPLAMQFEFTKTEQEQERHPDV